MRIFVTNRLQEPTTIHWHGILLPSGMDGVGGLNQPHIKPGETFAYEFDAHAARHAHVPPARRRDGAAGVRHDGHVHHPPARPARRSPVDRDYCFLLHNWALHPGTYRPDPSIMQDFDLWTFNSKVFPGDRAAGRAHRRAGAGPRRQPVDVESPDPPARRAVPGHRLGWRPLAAAAVAPRGHRARRRGPDPRPRVRRGAGRLGAALPHVAPHHERDGPRRAEHDRRGSVRRGGARSSACCPATWRWASTAWPSTRTIPMPATCGAPRTRCR